MKDQLKVASEDHQRIIGRAKICVELFEKIIESRNHEAAKKLIEANITILEQLNAIARGSNPQDVLECNFLLPELYYFFGLALIITEQFDRVCELSRKFSEFCAANPKRASGTYEGVLFCLSNISLPGALGSLALDDFLSVIDKIKRQVDRISSYAGNFIAPVNQEDVIFEFAWKMLVNVQALLKKSTSVGDAKRRECFQELQSIQSKVLLCLQKLGKGNLVLIDERTVDELMANYGVTQEDKSGQKQPTATPPVTSSAVAFPMPPEFFKRFSGFFSENQSSAHSLSIDEICKILSGMIRERQFDGIKGFLCNKEVIGRLRSIQESTKTSTTKTERSEQLSHIDKLRYLLIIANVELNDLEGARQCAENFKFDSQLDEAAILCSLLEFSDKRDFFPRYTISKLVEKANQLESATNHEDFLLEFAFTILQNSEKGIQSDTTFTPLERLQRLSQCYDCQHQVLTALKKLEILHLTLCGNRTVAQSMQYCTEQQTTIKEKLEGLHAAQAINFDELLQDISPEPENQPCPTTSASKKKNKKKKKKKKKPHQTETPQAQKSRSQTASQQSSSSASSAGLRESTETRGASQPKKIQPNNPLLGKWVGQRSFAPKKKRTATIKAKNFFPFQLFQQAKLSIIKENRHGIIYNSLPNGVRRLSEILLAKGYHVYLAGGAVRDLWYRAKRLGAQVKIPDYDIVTDAPFDEVKSIFNKYFVSQVGDLSMTFTIDGVDIDVAKLSHVSTPLSEDGIPKALYENAVSRDITVNALFLCLDPVRFYIIGPSSYVEDFQHSIIRSTRRNYYILCEQYMKESILILRALRVARKLQAFSVHKSILDAIQLCIPYLHVELQSNKWYKHLTKFMLAYSSMQAALDDLLAFDLITRCVRKRMPDSSGQGHYGPSGVWYPPSTPVSLSDLERFIQADEARGLFELLRLHNWPDINRQHEGQTPLEVAIRFNARRCFVLLLSAGADVSGLRQSAEYKPIKPLMTSSPQCSQKCM